MLIRFAGMLGFALLAYAGSTKKQGAYVCMDCFCHPDKSDSKVCARTVWNVVDIVFAAVSASFASDEPVVKDTTKIFICTGHYAKCCHKTNKCGGFDNCQGEVKEVTFAEQRN